MGMLNFSPVHPDCVLFLRIAEVGNISKVAEELGIGQSGLSKSIRRLEDASKTKLFVRRSQGVALTIGGEALALSLRKMMSHWQAPQELQKLIRVGGHSAVLGSVAAGFLSRLRTQKPELEVDLVLGTSLETTRRVANLEIDYGFVINPIRTADLVARRIEKQNLAVWGVGAQPKLGIAYNPEMIGSTQILRKFKTDRLIPVGDYQLVLKLAESGDFLGVLPSPLAEGSSLKRHGPILKEVQLALIYHQDRSRSSLHQALVPILIGKKEESAAALSRAAAHGDRN